MLKAFFQRIALLFMGGAKAVEAHLVADAEVAEQFVANKIGELRAAVSAENDARAEVEGRALVGTTVIIPEGFKMSTISVAPAAPATTNTNVDSAIKIALFLKALDANLTDAAVQDATNAALAAAYPAA
ncbi:MAG: hypothetical protein V4793_06695 [Paraburkholderia tropica]|uniref:hypothetical protein n=1 Tax=Paraburkholderia tropica TaxID=92647 RepID=UPI003100DC43